MNQEIKQNGLAMNGINPGASPLFHTPGRPVKYMTEKLLLYGQAIHLAGSVRARCNQRHATSDWMAMERERGISISSTVLQFPYRECVINLLDTPGHQDFSEDTYRTLMAVDSAVMVLDAAKGVEAQTRRLFEVSRQRGIPVFTFINKMDRPARDLLGLLDEVETVLGMQPIPMNWPIGDGDSFLGVYDRLTRQVYLYDRTVRNQTISPETMTTLDDARIQAGLSQAQGADLHHHLELLDALGLQFDRNLFLTGRQTPVYFGSALTNFGVQLFLDQFVAYAPAPRAYPSDAGLIEPDLADFSGFVFKIQANMNPKHRDSVAFVRVCSGRFERNMRSIIRAPAKAVPAAPLQIFCRCPRGSLKRPTRAILLACPVTVTLPLAIPSAPMTPSTSRRSPASRRGTLPG